MKMSDDLMLMGLCLGMAGTILWAKGILLKTKEILLDEVATYFGFNPIKLKSELIQQYETGIGVTLIGLGFIAQIASFYISKYIPEEGSLFVNEAMRLTILGVSVIFIVVMGKKLAYQLGFKMFCGVAKEKLLESYNANIFVVEHAGLDKIQYERKVEMPDEVKAVSLKSAREGLVRISKWFDLKQMKNESDNNFYHRLGIFLKSK